MDFCSLDFHSLVNVGASLAFDRSVDTATFVFADDVHEVATADEVDRRVDAATFVFADEVHEFATADEVDEVATHAHATDIDAQVAPDEAEVSGLLYDEQRRGCVHIEEEVAVHLAPCASDPYVQEDPGAQAPCDYVQEDLGAQAPCSVDDMAHDSDEMSEMSDGDFGQELRARSWEVFKKRQGRPRGGAANKRHKSQPIVVAPRIFATAPAAVLVPARTHPRFIAPRPKEVAPPRAPAAGVVLAMTHQPVIGLRRNVVAPRQH
jgi:hypothetical protein